MTDPYDQGREARERNDLDHFGFLIYVWYYGFDRQAAAVRKGWRDKHYELADEMSG